MKYIFAAVLGILLLSAKAEAFEWSALMNLSAKNIKTLFSSSTPAAVPTPAPQPGNCDLPLNIQPADARDFIDREHPVVIDIRTPEEYAGGHLASVTMQLDFYAPDFKEKLAALDRSAKYLLYCRSGRRTGTALGMMKEMGFTEIHDIAGGITAWTAAGFPIVK